MPSFIERLLLKGIHSICIASLLRFSIRFSINHFNALSSIERPFDHQWADLALPQIRNPARSLLSALRLA